MGRQVQFRDERDNDKKARIRCPRMVQFQRTSGVRTVISSRKPNNIKKRLSDSLGGPPAPPRVS
jgi:hypothetical protein